MANLNLYYPQNTVDLGLILALWSEVTSAWRPGFANNPFDLPMPVRSERVSLHTRIGKNPEHAYSFDVLCRLMARYRDRAQAVPELFADPANRKWLEKIKYPHGVRVKKDGTRELVDCVKLTDEAKAYWATLPTEARELAITRAETILSGDIESGGTIVSVLPTEALPVIARTGTQGITVTNSTTNRHVILKLLIDEIQRTPFIGHYRKKPQDLPAVAGWDQRLLAYFWPKPTVDYEATCRQVQDMLNSARELADAIQGGQQWDREQQTAAVELANRIFTWGGVPQDPTTVTAENVRQVFTDALTNNDHSEAPMNSGWTKVAAFATAHLEQTEPNATQVIWDSRVATALISRLDRLLGASGSMDPSSIFPGIGTVPGQGGTRPRVLALNWPVGYKKWEAQIKGSALVREIRDILNGSANYPRMPMPDGSTGRWTTRGVEMVLFMDGY